VLVSDIGYRKNIRASNGARWDCIQPSNIGGETIVNEPQRQVMMDRRFELALFDHFLLR